MKNFILIKKEINIAPLINQINKKREYWFFDTRRQDRVPIQRETHNIYLRKFQEPFPQGVSEAHDVHPSVRTAASKHFQIVYGWIKHFAKSVDGELGRAVLVQLKPQGRVYAHRDRGEYYKIRDRYHLVLQSTKGSVLICGGEEVRMKEGELWSINNKNLHEALNDSDDLRIHLIFDILPKGKTLFE